MPIIVPPTSQPKLIDFIIQSCKLEKIMVTPDDVFSTLNGKGWPHADAAGHLSGINYILKMAESNEVPCIDPTQAQTDYKADNALFWLREVHRLLMEPISQVGSFDDGNTMIQMGDVGNYRLQDRWMTLGRPLPRYYLVKSLLRSWLEMIAKFHFDNIHLVGTALKFSDTQKFVDMAWNAHLQLQCIHPFAEGTGRTCRLVENLLRQSWGLPWKVIPGKDRMKYIHQIMAYEDSHEWQTILKEHGNDSNFN